MRSECLGARGTTGSRSPADFLPRRSGPPAGRDRGRPGGFRLLAGRSGRGHGGGRRSRSLPLHSTLDDWRSWTRPPAGLRVGSAVGQQQLARFEHLAPSGLERWGRCPLEGLGFGRSPRGYGAGMDLAAPRSRIPGARRALVGVVGDARVRPVPLPRESDLAPPLARSLAQPGGDRQPGVPSSRRKTRATLVGTRIHLCGELGTGRFAARVGVLTWRARRDPEVWNGWSQEAALSPLPGGPLRWGLLAGMDQSAAWTGLMVGVSPWRRPLPDRSRSPCCLPKSLPLHGCATLLRGHPIRFRTPTPEVFP